jgi:hypothetical protein
MKKSMLLNATTVRMGSKTNLFHQTDGPSCTERWGFFVAALNRLLIIYDINVMDCIIYWQNTNTNLHIVILSPPCSGLKQPDCITKNLILNYWSIQSVCAALGRFISNVLGLFCFLLSRSDTFLQERVVLWD